MTLAKWINDPGDLAISWSIDLGDSQAHTRAITQPKPVPLKNRFSKKMPRVFR